MELQLGREPINLFHYYHTTPVLENLHRLNIIDAILYKVVLQTYQSLSSEGPAYLTRELVAVVKLSEQQNEIN